jgi:hypothetical protein
VLLGVLRHLPVLVPLAIAATLVAVFQANIVHTAPVEPMRLVTAQPTVSTARMVVNLVSNRSRIECSAPYYTLAADEVELYPEDLDRIARQICD